MNNLRAPVYVNLELTKRCNHLCRHCYNGIRENPVPERPFSPSHFSKLVSILGDAEVFSVVISGGEPLLLPDQVISAILTAERYNIESSINSNLTIVPPQIKEFLKDKRQIPILTSLYSNNAEQHDYMTKRKGSFHRTKRNIESLINECGTPVSVNCVVTKENLANIYDLGKTVADLGVSYFFGTAQIASSHDSMKLRLSQDEVVQMLEELQRVKEDFGVYTDSLQAIIPCIYWKHTHLRRFLSRTCTMGITSINISPEGNVQGCFHFNHTYGNIFKSEITEIWERLKSSNIKGNLFPECLPCDLSRICNSGCKAEKEYLVETITPSPITGYKPSANLELPDEFKFSLEDGINYRKEGENILVYLDRSLLLINPKTLDFIQSMNNQKLHKFKEILSSHSRFKSDFENLLKNGFISIKEE
jgi:radical SAM protein with 4Fe4S-binding SPASM domain